MELFSIECTTCQQRLNVRDESAIGEILICPKCGSMVLVEAPPDWQGTPSDEPARTSPVQPPPAAKAEEQLDETASRPGETAIPSRPTPAAPHVIVGGDETPPPSQEADTVDGPIELDAEQVETPLAAGQEQESGPAHEPPADGAVAPPRAPADGPAEPVLPTDDWTSEATQVRRQWLLVGGAAIVGMILAISLVGILASRRSRPEPADPVADGETGIESPQDTDSGTADSTPADGETENDTDAKPPAATDDEDDQGTEDLDKPSDPPADKDASSKPEETKPVEDPKTHASDPKVDAKQKTPSENDEKDKLILKPADDEPDATAMDTAALAKTLGLLAPITDSQPYTQPQPGEAAKETAPKLDPAALPLQGPSAPRPEPREVIVAERLKDEIPGIEFENTPLIDFLRFVTDFSTIPITLDPDALALMDITPQRPVSVKQANTNVADLLSETLALLGLGYIPLDGHLLVTRPPPPDGQLRSYSYPAGDLVGDDPNELARLADLVVEMVESNSWEVNGGVGIVHKKMPSLDFKHRDMELFRAITFCEKLRVARGLQPQSNLPKGLFKLEPRLSQAGQRLATPVTINYVQPASFVRILDRLGKEAGMQILVDWRAVAELGWTPDGEATISANNEPIGQALAKMLLPMDLTYRAVNATTVQITSPTSLIARLDIEFYPIENALLPQETPEALLQRVRKELGEEGLRDIGATIHLDTPSKHLIAALPQPWQKELADLLKP